ncbi:hypothetical protein POI8812_01165 [Pontivivens insulae]|uniref:Flagella basal body P-ring formation protein FlgA n=1 Tax=Pontivivens insulae TaxID=1639689 RepID=A0A2R8A9F1_9RHOB|nr:flagellar basal body P-ring formation chaperone FlgA [Pontivivens insulae]RED12771.1 flagella basal body P-ring formation protein FlgA [Pontivivens insulae]SPF28862.1 hypothetical protein POI8812_01165 [Pontivivens insulae]
MIRTFLILCLFAEGVLAQTVVPLRAIRAESSIGPGDVGLDDVRVPGAVARLEDVIGREARTTLYPGRPIAPGDLAEPAVVERNQVVAMRYLAGGLSIAAEGRVLSRARPGERIQVMNLQSRNTVWGVVTEHGVVEVGR